MNPPIPDPPSPIVLVVVLDFLTREQMQPRGYLRSRALLSAHVFCQATFKDRETRTIGDLRLLHPALTRPHADALSLALPV